MSSKSLKQVTFGLVFACFTLVGCSEPTGKNIVPEVVPEEAKQLEAEVFIFSEWEKGIEPYQARMIITKDFLRMDDGVAGGDFLLFDRRSKILSNLSLNDQTILKMKRKEVTLKPEVSEFSERLVDNKGMPAIDGKTPEHHAFLTGDKVCYEVITIAGMHPDAVLAMQEYLRTLAGEQAENIYKTPAEYRDVCMMSNLIYEPIAHLNHGFPIREWDYNGYGRALLDYSTQKLDASLFELNEDFHVYQLSEAGLPAKIK